MPDDDKPRDYHRQPSYTLRPADEEQRARWERRIAALKIGFTKWARELLDKDAGDEYEDDRTNG